MNFLPSAFDPDDETNSKLRKFKLARAGKWSLRSSKSLWDTADLATYLLALERYKEAAEIGGFIAQNVSFDGNYNRWTPAARAIAVGVRAGRLLGDAEMADRIYRPIREHPDYIINRAIEEQMIRQTPETLQNGSFLLVTRDNVVRIEDARAGRSGTEWYPMAEMEDYLVQALTAIRKSLG
jgi:hypothetical protein